MPLDKSGSDKSIGKNIKTEKAHGKPYKQALAIALSTKARAKKNPMDESKKHEAKKGDMSQDKKEK